MVNGHAHAGVPSPRRDRDGAVFGSVNRRTARNWVVLADMDLVARAGGVRTPTVRAGNAAGRHRVHQLQVPGKLAKFTNGSSQQRGGIFAGAARFRRFGGALNHANWAPINGQFLAGSSKGIQWGIATDKNGTIADRVVSDSFHRYRNAALPRIGGLRHEGNSQRSREREGSNYRGRPDDHRFLASG